MRHKYFCELCSLFVFGDDPDRLASSLNYHNGLYHPYLTSKWTGELIVKSRKYEVGDKAPAYLTPSPVGDKLMKLEQLTQEDRKFLAGLLVKWD
jgi:hypothetical protein